MPKLRSKSSDSHTGELVYEYFEKTLSLYVKNWDTLTAHKRNQALSRMLGITSNGVDKWRRDGIPTTNANSLKGAIDKFVSAMLLNSVKPIYEFKEVFPKLKFKRYQLFLDSSDSHPIENDLEGKTGVYVFYSSTGNIFYIGKASKNLAGEIHQRINQSLTNTSTDVFLTDLKTAKTLKMKKVDAVKYISVYETHPVIVHNIEAFLIRVSMNENLNKKKENFSDSLLPKRKKTKKRK